MPTIEGESSVDLADAGKIRHIGVSNLDLQRVQKAPHGRTIVCNQVRYHLKKSCEVALEKAPGRRQLLCP